MRSLEAPKSGKKTTRTWERVKEDVLEFYQLQILIMKTLQQFNRR